MDLHTVVEQNFVVVHPEMNLGEIVQSAVIKSNRNIFPVVDPKTDELVGIILLDDLRPVMFDQSLYKSITARDLMQNPPEIVYLETDKTTDVMKKFQDTGAWNLPVVKENRYFGFISKSKLLTAYRRKLIDYSGK